MRSGSLDYWLYPVWSWTTGHNVTYLAKTYSIHQYEIQSQGPIQRSTTQRKQTKISNAEEVFKHGIQSQLSQIGNKYLQLQSSVSNKLHLSFHLCNSRVRRVARCVIVSKLWHGLRGGRNDWAKWQWFSCVGSPRACAVCTTVPI